MERVSIKIPEIPKNISPELYNYFIQLHQNMQAIVDALNAIEV